jgi:hypothetical protein
LRFQLTIAVSGWKDALNTCASSQPQVGLVIHVAPPGQIDPSQADALLRFAEPPSGLSSYAAILDWDEVVVITHTSNPIKQISSQALLAIYTGKATTWGELELPGLAGTEQAGLPLQIWAYPPEDDVRQVFDQAILNNEKSTEQIYLAPDATAMLEAIARTPGSIGYILSSYLYRAASQNSSAQDAGGTPTIVSNVKQLRIANSLEGLRQPVLAVAPNEPQGDLRQLLLCLQNK